MSKRIRRGVRHLAASQLLTVGLLSVITSGVVSIAGLSAAQDATPPAGDTTGATGSTSDTLGPPPGATPGMAPGGETQGTFVPQYNSYPNSTGGMGQTGMPYNSYNAPRTSDSYSRPSSFPYGSSIGGAGSDGSGTKDMWNNEGTTGKPSFNSQNRTSGMPTKGSLPSFGQNNGIGGNSNTMWSQGQPGNSAFGASQGQGTKNGLKNLLGMPTPCTGDQNTRGTSGGTSPHGGASGTIGKQSAGSSPRSGTQGGMNGQSGMIRGAAGGGQAGSTESFGGGGEFGSSGGGSFSTHRMPPSPMGGRIQGGYNAGSQFEGNFNTGGMGMQAPTGAGMIGGGMEGESAPIVQPTAR